MRHPIQPLERDEHGAERFKPNRIVQYLLDAGPFDMNHLAMRSFPAEDREQFAQLIGYSLSGFAELGYVTKETYETAEKMLATGQTEEQARIEHHREVLETVRDGLRKIVPAVFPVNPDDLDG